jgi:hypothetical protein
MPVSTTYAYVPAPAAESYTYEVDPDDVWEIVPRPHGAPVWVVTAEMVQIWSFSTDAT